MDILRLINKSERVLRIMLEPYAECYDVPPGKTAEIKGPVLTSSKYQEIHFWDENFLAVWVTGSCEVLIDGEKADAVEDPN